MTRWRCKCGYWIDLKEGLSPLVHGDHREINRCEEPEFAKEPNK